MSPNHCKCFFFSLEFLNPFLGYENPTCHPRLNTIKYHAFHKLFCPSARINNSVIITMILYNLYLVLDCKLHEVKELAYPDSRLPFCQLRYLVDFQVLPGLLETLVTFLWPFAHLLF